MKSILEESQEQRNSEIARFLNVDINEVKSAPVEMQFGPPVYDGKDFRTDSYDFIYEEYGLRNPVATLKALSLFNAVKRRDLIYGAQWHIGKVKGARVMDFGCGVGGHGIHFLQAGAIHADLLDVKCLAREFAGWRLGERGFVEKSRIIGPDYKLGKYDILLCVDSLEHVANPLRTFKHLFEHTEKDAFILIQFGNYLNPRQGHFKQSKEIWWSKQCQTFIKRNLKKLDNYYYRKR